METPTEITASTCSEHQTEEVRFYCNECKTLICDDCVVGDHSKHDKIKLIEYGNKRREAIQSKSLEACNTRLPKIKRAIDLAEKVQKSLNESIDKDIVDIRCKRELIKKIFDELQDELIKDFDNARNAANEKFNEFKESHRTRCEKIKEITDIIQSKGSDISATEIAVFDSELDKLLDSYPLQETVPKIEPPKYQFHEDYIKKDNLRHFIGHLDYGNYDMVTPADIIPQSKTKEDSADESGSDFYDKSPSQKKDEKDKNFEIIKSLKCDKNVLHIVPKESCRQAWLVGKEICDLNYSTEKPTLTTLVSDLGGKPITAGRSRKHGLLIGLSGKKSIKQLQISSGTFRKNVYKLISHFSIESDQLSAMTTSSTSDKDITLCLKVRQLSGSTFFSVSENKYAIRRYSAAKMKVEEIYVSSSDIEIENPIHICENTDGDICITCSPEDTSSWIVLIDKNGNQKMRYPPKDTNKNDQTILCSFVGSGFLNDGTITILDRVEYRQHLIDKKGELLQVDRYKGQPICFAIDKFDNIWIGFDDGIIQMMNYNDRYETVEVKT